MERTKLSTFLGLPLYEKYQSSDTVLRKILGGLLFEVVRYDNYYERHRQISLFRIPLCGRSFSEGILRFHIGNSTVIFQYSIRKKLEKQLDALFATVPLKLNPITKRCHVFVLCAHAGEIALLFTCFMRNLLSQFKQNGDIVFLCTKQYHVDIASLFFPTIPTALAKPKILRFLQENIETNRWNVRVFFSSRYFLQYDPVSIQSSHVVDIWEWTESFLGYPAQPIQLDAPLVSRLKTYESCANRKLNNAGHWGKTIVVAPSSITCGSLTSCDVQTIINLIKQKGLEVYLNTDSGSSRLTFPEILSKAINCAGILGIRSGLMDFLLVANKPMLIFYPTNKDQNPSMSLENIRAYQTYSLYNHSRGAPITESPIDTKINIQTVCEWLDSIVLSST